MVTVAVLSADQRLSFQIHTWMKELADTVRWENHSDAAAFAHKIETEDAAELMAQMKSADDSILDAEDIGAGKSKAVTDAYFRLLIVDLDLLGLPAPQVVDWVRKTKKLLDARQRSDPQYPCKVLLLAFEGGSFKADAFRDPVVDDLILKPLDRSVFLQKIEILTSDDPGIKPTFLFRQETDIRIEIGKDATVDEVSEFGLALRNPAPLAPGVFAAIHSAVLGAGEMSRVIGRVYKSEPHPRFADQYLVRFGFFGLQTEQMSNIKKYVRDRQPPVRSRPPMPTTSDQDPAVPFNRVAVIEMNPDVFAEIQSALKDHYIGVQSTHYLSYARFQATLKNFFPSTLQHQVALDTAAATTAAQSEPEALDDTHGLRPWTMPGELSLVVLSSTMEFLRFESPVGNGDLIFGRTKSDWIDRAGEFFSRVDKLDAGELQEMMSYTVSGGRGRGYIKISDQQRRLYFFEMHSNLLKAGEGEEGSQVQIILKPVEKKDYEEYVNRSRTNARKIQASDLMYDVIFIDVNLIRDDIQTWFDAMHEGYIRAGIIMPGGPMPKIVLLAEEKSRTKPDDYRFKIVSDFLYKPLDRKMISAKAKLVVNELIPRREPDAQPFVLAEFPARLAKDAQMLEISEYGISISHPTAFRKGAMMRFFSPLFGGGAEGVLGRCSHCQKLDEKDPTYECHFLFFGTPDENLKRIRRWIREDYVQRKEVN